MTQPPRDGVRLPGLCRWMLDMVAPLVPGPDRRRWREEWDGELWHAGRPGGAGPLALGLRCLGAFPHALSLRKQEWRPEMIARDLRFAIRSLMRRPTFTAVAVLTLALGIGGNTAIFSLVKEVILEPLPYPDADELVMVWEAAPSRGRNTNVVNPANFLDWREQNTVFDGMAAFLPTTANLTGLGEPEEIEILYASSDLTRVLGLDPVLGRGFRPDEDGSAGSVAVVSYGFWQRRGADPEVVGSSLTLNGESVEIVGVLPPDAQVLEPNAELWVPIQVPERRRGRSLRVVARLRDGVSVEQARAEMVTIAARLEEAHPDFNDQWSANVQPLTEHVVGDVRGALLALLAAVGFLLLIACANVANLLLGRAAGRRQELALRTSLGATRGHLVRQLLTESAVLAAVGAVGGVILAAAGIRWLVGSVPDDLTVPRLASAGLDLQLLLFALGVAVVTAVLFGLLPAWDAVRSDLSSALRDGGRGGTQGRSSGRLRSGLIVTEVALSLMLLVGAGLMGRSFAALLAVDSGIHAENVITAEVNLRGTRYPDPQARMAFITEWQNRMRATPGVTAVGTNSFLPLTGIGSATSFYPLDRAAPNQGDRPVANMRFVTGDYFEAMGIALLAGRVVDDRDDRTQRPVVVVNRTLAQAQWPDESPVGKRVSIGWGEDTEAEVVGVVADVLHEGVREGARASIYVPWQQLDNFPFAAIAVRTAGDPTSVVRALMESVTAIDPDLPLTRIRTMQDVSAAAVAQPRLTTFLMGAFAVLALLLAAVGIYGVMSFNVSCRINEMGIRMALGARASDVVGLVVRHGMRLALAGVALGVLGAVFASKIMESLLYQVRTTDVATYGGVAVVLVGVALLACYLPARRATRVDPVTALRQE